MPLNTVDISNYTGVPTADQLAAWKALGVRLVIVQAVDPPPAYPPRCDREQAQAVLDAGLALGAYVFHWSGTSLARQNAERFAGYGFPIERWWGDFEDTGAADPYQREAECTYLLAQLDTLPARRPAGAYTGPWWVAGFLPPGSRAFAGRALWVAEYDGVDTPGAPALCGGTVVMHQYAGTSTLSGVGNVDLNAALESEFMDPQPDPTPTPEPDYRVALASVTAPTGEIVPALLAAKRLTSVKAMRPAVQAVADRLAAINTEFQP